MNKKGYSTGMTWVFGLIMLFGIGLCYLIFNQALTEYVAPAMEDVVNNSQYINDTIRQEISNDNEKWGVFWQFVPYIFFVVILLYIVVGAIIGEER